MSEPTALSLVGRYFDQAIGQRDMSVFAEILDPGYIFHAGIETVVGRDEHYVPMVKAYLDEQPTIAVSVHETLSTDEFAAVRLTKSTTEPLAAWPTVLVYRRGSAGYLTECWYEQDWSAYRRQLRGIDPAPTVPKSLPLPWQAPPGESNPSTEHVARQWIERNADGTGFGSAPSFDVGSVSVDCLFGVGNRFAFRGTQHGTYSGGVAGYDSCIGRSLALVVAGFGTVQDARVIDTWTVADHDIIRRQLRTENHR